MISILIPVYNFDVRTLVQALSGQCRALIIPWEIICVDDGSSDTFRALNRETALIPGVRYEELLHNVGRSAIRNHLADMAAFQYLLFMDCDSAVIRPDYMARYAGLLHPECVLYGGRAYAAHPPENPDLLLHWTVGSSREVMAAAVRSRRPWHAFMTNNFLISKEIFLSIRFDERLREYGHEDTLFGIELARRKISVVHLDNPLEHIGLETAEVFLEKSEQAVRNLVWLQEQGIQLRTRLLLLAGVMLKTRLYYPVRLLLAWAVPVLRRNLLSTNPSLRCLDALKLFWLLRRRK